MSRLTKIMLGAAVPLLLVGGFTAFAGWRMGAEPYMDVRWRDHEFRLSPFGLAGWNEYGLSAPENRRLSADELPAFQKLEVDMDVGDLTVQTGEAANLSLSWGGADYELHSAVEDGLLRIWSTGSANQVGVNHYESDVVLTVPVGTVLTDVDVEIDVGDLWFYGVSAKDVSITSDVGDVTALDLRLDGPLAVTGGVGDVDVSGHLAGTLDLSTNVGDLVLSTNLSRTDYTWDLSAGMGELVLDGVTLERDGAKGGAGQYAMSADTDVGDLLIYFSAPVEVSVPAPEKENIVDLPRELFQLCPEFEDKNTGRYADALSYDFAVDETTKMTIDVENLSGTLELGIKKKAGFGWAYDQRAFDTERDSVELEPGQYSLVIHAEAFQGSYHLTGENV